MRISNKQHDSVSYLLFKITQPYHRNFSIQITFALYSPNWLEHIIFIRKLIFFLKCFETIYIHHPNLSLLEWFLSECTCKKCHGVNHRFHTTSSLTTQEIIFIQMHISDTLLFKKHYTFFVTYHPQHFHFVIRKSFFCKMFVQHPFLCTHDIIFEREIINFSAKWRNFSNFEVVCKYIYKQHLYI